MQAQPLGNTTRFASASGEKSAAADIARARAKRFALQGIARELLPGERVANCLRAVRPESRGVEIWQSSSHEKAHYKGLMPCGSVWTCPVCASKITERRREELSRALEVSKEKYSPVMVTVTFSHSPSDSLKDLLEVLNSAWRSLKSGRFWNSIKERYGIVGAVSALEVTIGSNGWHPHKHSLFFCSKEVDASQLEHELSQKWQSILSKKERYASALHGLSVKSADKAAAEYISKLSKWTLDYEMSKAPVKKSASGMSAFQLLELSLTAKSEEQRAWCRAKFIEYSEALKSKHFIQWSAGLKALLGIEEPELTDEEIAELAEDDSVFLALLTREQWRLVCANDIRAELLEVASSGDVSKLWSFLGKFGIFNREVT